MLATGASKKLHASDFSVGSDGAHHERRMVSGATIISHTIGVAAIRKIILRFIRAISRRVLNVRVVLLRMAADYLHRQESSSLSGSESCLLYTSPSPRD